MKKKTKILTALLLIFCLGAAAFFVLSALHTQNLLKSTEAAADTVLQKAEAVSQELKNTEVLYDNALAAAKAANPQNIVNETAVPVTPEDTDASPSSDNTKPSIFNHTGQTSSNGYIIGIDPGHQSENIDMSATEPDGPGSTVMKAMSSTGTQGSYTGVPEYQLNLEVSLKLKKILEERGYQVVLTRTDNETAISNSQRAQLVAQQGADIYVRIHANGDDTHTASGALTMSPSAENPYVSHLYEDSNRLSQCILDAYCAATGFANLGVQYYDNMTGINWSSVPVTIVEMGFMTYENDDRQMNDPEFQNIMASGIADGIDAYFGL
jgi:N-acetylmuramoyl-L-alanine amidase